VGVAWGFGEVWPRSRSRSRMSRVVRGFRGLAVAHVSYGVAFWIAAGAAHRILGSTF
jgi:hypothetical protein